MSKENDVLFQAARRRTVAIISHPDAGKTTLTEKFLLYAGAVQEAGAVKARAGARSSTSDWMALERERGISISSTVLQFPYRDHVFNLLDTPGHKDFSEDTYRVLAAVDAVVMVLDIAKGIESQTLKLFQVCRSRNLPVLTFFNKYDRPGRDPLELLDEVEKQIGLRPTPATWPVGIPGDFRGVIDRRTNEFIRFTRTARGGSAAPEEIVPNDRAAAEEGPAWQAALEGCALLSEIGANVDLESFLAGETTPVFVGSALTNFGVRMLLDAVIDLAPAAVARQNLAGEPQPLDNEFSAFVFKIQANMDPSHRDRIAFVRVLSGRFEHGMKFKVLRTGKDFRPTSVVTFLSQRRDRVDEAYAGDIIGLTTHGGLQLGDSLSEGEGLQFTGLPFFAPELFASVELKDPMRSKQLQKGLMELGQEGAIQVFKPLLGSEMLLGAIGQLQFEVVQARLKGEYGVEVRLAPSRYSCARWVTSKNANDLRRFMDANVGRMVTDAADTHAFLATSRFDLDVMQKRWETIEFHPMREHAGLLLANH